MKTLISTLFVVITVMCHLTCTAQKYFVVGKDTTFCTKLSYLTTSQGALNQIKYTDSDGKSVEIKGKSNVPDVTTFCINGVCSDKIPLKANKPNSYKRYTERIVDGKLKVYLAQQGHSSNYHYTPGAAAGDWSDTGGPVGIYRFFIKMPDGTYYKINSKKNMNKYIKPYLLKCSEFKSEYSGDFSTEELPFMQMIQLYNSLCN